MAIPNPSEPKPVASARAADDLGQGWKVRPFIRVNAGETAVLMDVAGPGIIQHIWLVEGLNRGLVLRFYLGRRSPHHPLKSRHLISSPLATVDSLR